MKASDLRSFMLAEYATIPMEVQMHKKSAAALGKRLAVGRGT